MPDGRLIRLWLFDQELVKYDVNLGGLHNPTGDLAFRDLPVEVMWHSPNPSLPKAT